MTSGLVRRIAVAAMMIWAIAAPALAQSVPLPPTYVSVDGNGVDLTTGTFNYSKTDISIGSPGAGGLAYSRSYGSGFGWVDSFQSNIIREVVAGQLTIYVAIGGISDAFQPDTDSTYVSLERLGSTLTFGPVDGTDRWTYTSSNGTKVVFDFSTTSCDPGLSCGVPAYIVYPSGDRTTFSYQSQTYCSNGDPLPNCGGAPDALTTARRLSSVATNRGYQLKFGYAYDGDIHANTSGEMPDDWLNRTSVNAFNNAITYCNPFANSCSGALASATYGTTTGGITVTDAASRITTYYMTGSQLTGIKLPGDTTNTLDIAYASGRVSSVSNAGPTGSDSWTYSYSTSSSTLTTTVTDPLAHTRTVVVDTTLDRPTSDTNGVGKTTSYAYDEYGRVTRVTAPETNKVEYSYDTRGNVIETRVYAKGASTPSIVTKAGYDSSCANSLICNQPNWTADAIGSQTDPVTHKTEYTYSSTHGGLLTIEAPAPSSGAVRPKTTIGYTELFVWLKASGSGFTQSLTGVYLPTSTTSCLSGGTCSGESQAVRLVGYQTGSSTAGSNLLPVTATAKDGQSSGGPVSTVTTAYDNIGNAISVDGPISGTADTVHYRYDAVRQLTGVIQPDPNTASAARPAQRTTYDLQGRPTAVDIGTVTGTDWATFAASQTTTTEYDIIGRPIVAKLVSGSTIYSLTQSNYDAANRLDCTAVRMNPGEFSSLPDACTLDTAGAYGPDRITKTSYDNANRVTVVTQAYGVAGQARDTVTTTYTDNGQIATVKDAKSNLTTYVYDGVDRLSRIRYPDPATINSSSTTDYEERTYDANSNVSSLRTRSAQTIGLTYDALNRLTMKDLPGGSAEDVYLNYDNLGQLTSALYGSTSGSGVAQTWDALGRLTSQTSYGRTLAYQYDAAGNRTRITWPDTAFWVQYDYNDAYTVTAIRENGATSGPGELAKFTYDDHGRRASITRGNGTTTAYGYDDVSRLDELVQNLAGTSSDFGATLAYTPASQIRERTQANDAAYAWKAAANQSVAYGTNGLNQVTSVQGINLGYDANGNLTRGAASYTYDVENKLRSASGPASVTIDYDPLGRLKQTASAAATTTFLYDGNDLVAEYASSTLTKRYVHGPGVDEPLVSYDGSGNRSWLHADERGSIVAVSDNSGATSTINTYSPDGQPSSWISGRFGYTGQIAIGEAAIWHYKARAYAPRAARFLQTDPIGYGAGTNLYAYVYGDPINQFDPMGLAASERNPNVTYKNDPPRQAGTGTLMFGRTSVSSTLGSVSHGIESPPQGRNGGVFDSDDGTINVLASIGIGHNGGPPLTIEAERARLLGIIGARVSVLAAVLWSTPAAPASEAADVANGKVNAILRPNGKNVGIRGSSNNVRMVSPTQFNAIQSKLLQIGASPISNPSYPGQMYGLPGGGTFGLRVSPGSGPTIDINVPGLPAGFRLHVTGN